MAKLPTSLYAKKLGLTHKYVLGLIRRGRLQAVKGEWDLSGKQTVWLIEEDLKPPPKGVHLTPKKSYWNQAKAF